MEPVTVWWAALCDLHSAHVTLLNAVERARRERYLRAADKDRFTLGVAITRLAAGARLALPPRAVPIARDCADCDRPHGPPKIAGGPHVSVSHSGDRVAVALSPYGPLGVDVEALAGRTRDGIARRVLAPGESPEEEIGEERLLAYWTRKEALLKATEDGLRVPLTDLRVSPPDAAPRLLDWAGRPGLAERFTMHPLDPGPGHLACLALLDHPDAVPVREHPARDLLAPAAPS